MKWFFTAIASIISVVALCLVLLAATKKEYWRGCWAGWGEHRKYAEEFGIDYSRRSDHKGIADIAYVKTYRTVDSLVDKSRAPNQIDSLVLTHVAPAQIDSTFHTHRWDCPWVLDMVITTSPPTICHKTMCKCLDCGADSSYHWDEPMGSLGYSVAPAPTQIDSAKFGDSGTPIHVHDWCWGDTLRPRGFYMFTPPLCEIPGICRICLAETTATWRYSKLSEYEKLKAKKTSAP